VFHIIASFILSLYTVRLAGSWLDSVYF